MIRFLRDEEFVRAEVPMTKEEIRILSIGKLGICENDRCLDIGAGSGSITVEMARRTKGEVVAIEIEDKALEVMGDNYDKFDLKNIRVVKGEALELFDKLEGSFDRIFVGGSKGNIEGIIKAYTSKLNNRGTMVLNFVTLSNLSKGIKVLEDLGLDLDIVQVSVSRARVDNLMLIAQNPIFIVRAQHKKES